jgi:hypothetical protein
MKKIEQEEAERAEKTNQNSPSSPLSPLPPVGSGSGPGSVKSEIDQLRISLSMARNELATCKSQLRLMLAASREVQRKMRKRRACRKNTRLRQKHLKENRPPAPPVPARKRRMGRIAERGVHAASSYKRPGLADTEAA